MGTGYQSTINDIKYLLSVASVQHREEFAGQVQAVIQPEGKGFRYFDVDGTEITLAEIHRRSQIDPVIQRSVYNLWMTYAH